MVFEVGIMSARRALHLTWDCIDIVKSYHLACGMLIFAGSDHAMSTLAYHWALHGSFKLVRMVVEALYE